MKTYNDTKAIIKKWYDALSFDKAFDSDFAYALESIHISEDTNISMYDKDTDDGRKNLLSYLYMCEELKHRYAQKGIGDDILIDTLSDLPRWTDTWSEIKGGLYLGELHWLCHHLDFKLFKLGRLQFCFGKAECDIESIGVKKGDNTIEIHIPACGALTPDECQRSIDMAKEFYKKFFPEYEYKCFTCHSWLLDESLKKLLGENSNIIKYGNMFEKVYSEKSDDIVQYVFRWDKKRSDVATLPCHTSLAQKVKDYIAQDGEFHLVYGFLK